jgi:heme-degrading monooxygenase HmoA
MMSKRDFLLALLALYGQNAKGQAGQVFLQLTLYDRIPEKGLKPYFGAIDREYIPEMKKAAGLISYQRFRHYDLPEKASIELWKTEQAAKAWHEGERARQIWQAAMKTVPQGIGVGAEYRQAMHSMVHRHYFLE